MVGDDQTSIQHLFEALDGGWMGSDHSSALHYPLEGGCNGTTACTTRASAGLNMQDADWDTPVFPSHCSRLSNVTSFGRPASCLIQPWCE